MTDRTIHLGYEVGSGEPVAIPIRHMAVTGQTQEAGKTTTLEALIGRGAAQGLRAVAFVTKRGERSFQSGTRIRPYFRERADWQFVSAVFEATLREKMRFERGWIMRACKGATTLADVRENVRRLLSRAKGLSEDVYFRLDEYLELVVPQIEKLPYGDTVSLAPGLNIMDLSAYSSELQALVIRSVLEWVYEREVLVVVVVPEAWEFIPQRRGSPVKLAAEELIRKGAGLGNYLWLDSQDLAGVDAAIRKSVIVWLLGVQREENEVKRVLNHIPNAPKPTVSDVMQLGKGQFFACWADQVRKVYVQPAWMDEEDAEAIARGSATVDRIRKLYASMRPAVEGLEEAMAGLTTREDEMSAEERQRYEERIRNYEQGLATANERVQLLEEDRDRAAAARDQDATVIEHLRALLAPLDALRRALTAVLGSGPLTATEVAMGVRELTAAEKRETINEIAALVLQQLGTHNGQVVQVTAPEALRLEYQQKEAERILATVRALTPTQRDILRLLEAIGGFQSQATIAARLGKTRGGWLTEDIAMLASAALVTNDSKRGVRANLRGKIAEGLAHYQAGEDDVEQTYQQCLHALATSAVPAG